MSDETKTPETKSPETPASPDGYSVAFKALQADVSRLERELKSRDDALAAAVAERDGLKGQVETFTRKGREEKLVAGLRGEFPGVPDMQIRGVLAVLAEGGEVDRYPEDSKVAEVVKAAAEKMKPALVRPPAQGGGPGGAPLVNGRKQAKTLI